MLLADVRQGGVEGARSLLSSTAPVALLMAPTALPGGCPRARAPPTSRPPWQIAPQPVAAAGPSHQLEFAPLDAAATLHAGQLGRGPVADELSQAAPEAAEAQHALSQSVVRYRAQPGTAAHSAAQVAQV